MALSAAVLGLAELSVAGAAPATNAQIEISFLLGVVEGSGCEFQRNGRWYASPAAQEHRRAPYDVLLARDLIQTAEQFIDKAASESSLSGQPYQVRCHGGPR
jgi:hypothetical protein